MVALGATCSATQSPPGTPAPTASQAILADTNPLSLAAAREAHRRRELRRQLRYLEAQDPGYLLRETARALPQAEIAAGKLTPAELYEAGRLLFEHEYSFADGLGSGGERCAARGHAGSPFRRVHEGRFGGPETTSCNSCHWRGGLAGAGSLQDASFIYGDGDRIESADPRNPPSLQGAGVVEILAAEMSAELQAAREALVAEARRQGRTVVVKLASKGILFGELRSAGDGTVDASAVEGVDPDLVVKPFGWKGTFAGVRDFVAESLQIHFGIQSEELVHRHRSRPDPELLGDGSDLDDPDGDGIRKEITEGQLSALVAFLALLEVPVIRPQETLHGFGPAAKNLTAPTATVFVNDWARGREIFHRIECSTCHVPMLVLKEPLFRTRSGITGAELVLDLARDAEAPRIEYDPRLGGYPVWLFSDLKRHDLGQENASRHADHGVAPELYLTRRLWGLASTPPYFYDGHAPWFDGAILAHGGEAASSRNAFSTLSREEKGALRVYLHSLRRERRLVAE